MKDQSLILIPESITDFYVAELLKNWTDDLIAATNENEVFDADQKKVLERNHIRLIEERIIELDGTERDLQVVVFESGEKAKYQVVSVRRCWIISFHLLIN